VSELYKEAKIFVLSSLNEGLSNVLIESAFYGCARLSSDTAGAKELIKDGFSGVLFKCGDTCELASKLENLMRDEALQKRLQNSVSLPLPVYMKKTPATMCSKPLCTR